MPRQCSTSASRLVGQTSARRAEKGRTSAVKLTSSADRSAEDVHLLETHGYPAFVYATVRGERLGGLRQSQTCASRGVRDSTYDARLHRNSQANELPKSQHRLPATKESVRLARAAGCAKNATGTSLPLTPPTGIKMLSFPSLLVLTSEQSPATLPSPGD